MVERKVAVNVEPKIKIYVICHKDSYVPPIDLLYPIQVGTELANKEIPGMLHDNTGDNISSLNKRYCELTAQYWAWKNDDADYYGFMHYRRYFSFNPAKLDEDGYGEIAMDRISEENLQKLYYDSEMIKKRISDYDVLTVTPTDLKGLGETVYGHWEKNSPYHFIEDFDLAIKIIIRDYPYLRDAVEEYINSTTAYFCNMFILKKELFNEYNEWLFEILHKHETEKNFESYCESEYRVSAYLAERLWGIYYTYLKSRSDVKWAELQRTLFTDTEKECHEVEPVFSERAVPIVFSANQNYVPYLAVVLQSVIECSTDEHNYDILVFHRDIEKDSQKILQGLTGKRKNISIRFFDCTYLVEKVPFRVGYHLSVETYYRYYILDIMNQYPKILYLDSDMIIQQDVAQLFKTDIQGYYLAAVKDLDTIGNYRFDKVMKEYLDKELKLDNPLDYFQAGVLLMNLDEMRKDLSSKKMVEMTLVKLWRQHDQDVLNLMCQSKVKFLPQKWNVLINWKFDGKCRTDFLKYAPYKLYGEYLEAYKKPFIIHYAGGWKPWNNWDCEMKEYFWKYARKTPLYEEILRRLWTTEQNRVVVANVPVAALPVENIDYHGIRIQGVNDSIYTDGMMIKLINYINRKYPMGSAKRERVKKIASHFIK